MKGRYSKDEIRKARKLAFVGRWENLPRDLLQGTLPRDIVKNVQYDLKRDPARYVMKMCNIMGDSCDICFLPTRRSNVPCYCKLDTEDVAQLFILYSERLEMRKSLVDRSAFNEQVWKKVLKTEILEKKYTFHQEISTDGVAVSILYSRTASPRFVRSNEESGSNNKSSSSGTNDAKSNNLPSRSVGLDPGKNYIGG